MSFDRRIKCDKNRGSTLRSHMFQARNPAPRTAKRTWSRDSTVWFPWSANWAPPLADVLTSQTGILPLSGWDVITSRRKWHNQSTSGISQLFTFQAGFCVLHLWCNAYGDEKTLQPFKAQWLLYVPPCLTFTNSTFCPHECLCVLCGSQNKQRLFPYTASTDWFL
jgi:hypothetical protein